MSPIEVVQKAICCPSGNCYAIEYNFKYPQKHQHPCMSHTKEPEAAAVLLALSQMEPTPGMVEALKERLHDDALGENERVSFGLRDALAAAVKEQAA